MTDQPTYEELVERNRRLANIIVQSNDRFEQVLRAEVKKAQHAAWQRGYNSGYSNYRDRATPPTENPYKED